MRCKHCNYDISSYTPFCPGCGDPVDMQEWKAWEEAENNRRQKIEEERKKKEEERKRQAAKRNESVQGASDSYKANSNTSQQNRDVKPHKSKIPLVLFVLVGLFLFGKITHWGDNSNKSYQETAAAAETATAATTSAPEPLTVQFSSVSEGALDNLTLLEMGEGGCTESSFLVQSKNINNKGYMAFDGDLSTSWQDGVKGDGIGEWIHADFGGKYYDVSAIRLFLGNHRSEEWYWKNNRPKTLTIVLGEETITTDFPDVFGEHVLLLSRPVNTSIITLKVDAVYEGSKHSSYQDTCISDIEVWYK